MMLCLSLQIGKLDLCWMNVIGKKKHPPQVHYFVLTLLRVRFPPPPLFIGKNSPTELEKKRSHNKSDDFRSRSSLSANARES